MSNFEGWSIVGIVVFAAVGYACPWLALGIGLTIFFLMGWLNG